MTFSEILPLLHQGFPVRRESFYPSFIIFEQVPATIDNVAPMQSIPQQVKDLLLKHKVGIDYDFQYIIYDFITGLATDCVFDGEDLNAQDWEVVHPYYDPYAGE